MSSTSATVTLVKMAPVHLCVLLVISSCVSQTFSKPVSGGSELHERSDDPQPLGAVVDNLASRLARVEASSTEMQNELGVLRAKRCESGVVGFAPHAQANVIAPDGNQSRTHTIHINFARPFATTPWVSIGMSEIDGYNTANLRISLSADGVSTSGFNAHALEWADTNILSATATWVACNV